MKRTAIGVIGGMGPGASAYMYKLLIDIAITKFGAKNNDDFPEIILYSVPVPDFISNQKARRKALRMLNERVVHLNGAKISSIAIACNTAHILLRDLQTKSKIPFKSMIKEVCLEVNYAGFKKIGLLGTPTLLQSGLYQDELKKINTEVIVPFDDQINLLEKVIRNILAGKLEKVDQKTISRIADSLYKRGAEGIVLGCTELPLLFPQNSNLKIFNSLEILSEALLRDYYKSNTI